MTIQLTNIMLMGVDVLLACAIGTLIAMIEAEIKRRKKKNE